MLFQKIWRNLLTMTDEIDVIKKAVIYYDRAVLLKRMNEELHDQLIGSIVWLLKYSDKYWLSVPKRIV
jgi:hypothetical protein